MGVSVNEFRLDETSQDHGVLRIETNEYNYFDFLTCNFLRNSGNASEQSAIKSVYNTRKSSGAYEGTPGPLSVGIVVLCDGGDTMVAGVRGGPNNGGTLFSSGELFCVGEGVLKEDFSYAKNNATSVPHATAIRGLFEELYISGDEISAVAKERGAFTLCSTYLDYKFLGYFKTDLTQKDILQRWYGAPDKSESSELHFIDVSTRNAKNLTMKSILSGEQKWSRELAFSFSQFIYKQ